MITRFGVALILLLPCAAHGQAIPEFDKIRTPTSPAFVVLGIAPAQVERPTTPSAFTASFLDRLGSAGGLLPSSFAVETAPYWWVSRPTLTFDDYRNADRATRILRSTTISLAVTDSVPHRSPDAGTDSDYRRIGFGLRTTLLPPDTLPLPPCVGALQRVATDVSSAIGAQVAAAIAADPTLAADSARLERLQAELLAAIPAEQRELLTDGAEACTEALAAGRGWTVDAAAGAAVEFPGSTRDVSLGSLGVWLTPAFLGDATSAAGVFRLQLDGMHTDTTSTILDAGFRAFRSVQRYSLSAEAVYRHISRDEASDDLIRLGLIFDVLLGGDTWLTLSFGREFAAEDARSVIALANLQWNVGGRGARAPVQ